MRGRLQRLANDPLVVNPWLILLTMVLSSGFGALFWLSAARLQSAADVGIAGSLVATGDALAVFGQLGMNVVLTRVLPLSDRKAADLVSGCAVVVVGSAVFAAAYVLLLPMVSPDLAEVLTLPWALVFIVLVAATGLNHLTDALFLAIDRVRVNLVINGVMLGIIKVALPFVLVGAGALGLFSAFGISGAVAAVVSVWAILRAVPGRALRRPSRELLGSKRFTGAGYLTSVLYLVPQLVFPLVVINALGPAANGRYFVAFQIATLLNAVVYAVCNSMYAEASRHPHRVHAIVRRSGQLLAGATLVGALGLAVVAPLVLRVFGPEYAAAGSAALRVLALGSLGVALNFWAAMRLRLAGHHTAMITVQLLTTVLMLGMALLLVHRGIEWVGIAWGVGQLVGGIVGYVVSRTIAPMVDTQPRDTAPHEVTA